MKKNIYLTAFIILTVTGCSVTEKPATLGGIESVTVFDFRDYTAQGFFISTDTYHGKYDPIGLISIKIYPKWVLEKKENTSTGYGEPSMKEEYVEIPFTTDDVIGAIQKEAEKLGANGIIQLEIEPTVKRSYYDGRIISEIYGSVITGMAININ